MLVNLLLLLVELLILESIVLGLHTLRKRYGLTPLLLFLGGLTGLLQFTSPLGIFVRPFPWLSLPVGSVVLVPVILMGVLILYIADGTAAARQAIFGVLGVSAIVLLLLFTGNLHLSLPGGGNFAGLESNNQVVQPNLREIISSITAFLADLFAIAIIFQAATNRRIPVSISTGLGLLGSLIVDALVFPFLYLVGSSGLVADLPSHLVGKPVAALVLWPLAAIYITRVAIRQPGYAGEQPRKTFEVLFGRLGQMESDLRRTEAHLAAIINSARDAIIITDSNLRIILFNRAAEGLFGITIDQALGQPLARFLPEGFRDTRQPIVDQGISLNPAGVNPRLLNQTIGIRTNGEQFPVEASISLITIDGEIFYTAILRDITERQQAERALQENQSNLALLNEITLDALLMPDLHRVLQALVEQLCRAMQADIGYITLWNDTRRVTTLGAIYGEGAIGEIGQSTPPGEVTVTWLVLQEGRPIASEDSRKVKGYNTAYIEQIGSRSSIALPLIANERKLGAVFLHYRQTHRFTEQEINRLGQITSQVSLAIDKVLLLDETKQSLQREQSLNELASLLNAAQDFTTVLPDIVQRACDLTRADAGVLALISADNQTLSTAYTYHLPPGFQPKPRSRGEGIAWEVIDSRRPVLVSYYPDHPRAISEWIEFGVKTAIEVPVVSGEVCLGVLILFNLSSKNLFTERDLALAESIGRHAGVAIEKIRLLTTLEQRVAERTAELATVNQQLADANEQLKEVDKLKDQFVSNVSHELRAPITNIMLYLELLERHKIQGMETHLAILKNEAQRLSNLIEDLLTLTRLDQNQSSFHLERYSLDQILEKVHQTYLARVENKNLKWTHLPNSQAPLVPLGYPEMMQVFNNMIGNAVSYTPDGGAITVRVELIPGHVRISITNDGPPIPKEEIHHIFERFYRGRTGYDSGEPGTGLGLAICKEIVERHGGRIGVDSSPGHATTFHVDLPVKTIIGEEDRTP